MRCAHAEAVPLRVRDPSLRSASDGDDTMPRELREVALIGFNGGKRRRHIVGADQRLGGELCSRLLVVRTRRRGKGVAGTEQAQREEERDYTLHAVIGHGGTIDKGRTRVKTSCRKKCRPDSLRR